MRYETIQELIDLCSSDEDDLLNTFGILSDCIRMLSFILFRTLPVPPKTEYNPVDIEVPFLDPDWDYLELVHTFFLQLVGKRIKNHL